MALGRGGWIVLLLISVLLFEAHSKGGTGGRPYGYSYGYVGYGIYPGYYSPYGYGRPSMVGYAGFMVLPPALLLGGYYMHSHYGHGHYGPQGNVGASGWTPTIEDSRGCVDYNDPCGCAFDRLMDFMNNNCTLMFVAGQTEALCTSQCRRFLKARTDEVLGYCSDDPHLTPGLKKELRDMTIQYGLQCLKQDGEYCMDYITSRAGIALEDVNWTDPRASDQAQAAYCAPCMSLASRLEAAYGNLSKPDPSTLRSLARGAYLSRVICGRDPDGSRCFPSLARSAGLGATPAATPLYTCGGVPCPGVWQRGDASSTGAVVALPALLPVTKLLFNVTAQPTSGSQHLEGWWREAFHDWRFRDVEGAEVAAGSPSVVQTATGVEIAFDFGASGALFSGYDVTLRRNTSSLVLSWVVNGTTAKYPATPLALQFAIVPARRTKIAQNLTAVFDSAAGPITGLEALEEALVADRSSRDTRSIAKLLASGLPRLEGLCGSGTCVQRMVWDLAGVLGSGGDARATATRLQTLARLLCLRGGGDGGYCVASAPLFTGCSTSAGPVCATGACGSGAGLECCVYAAALYGAASGNWSTLGCSSACGVDANFECRPSCGAGGSPQRYNFTFDADFAWYIYTGQVWPGMHQKTSEAAPEVLG